MLAILSFFLNRRTLQLGAAAILIGAAALAWHSYAARGRTIARLEAEIAGYEDAARALEARASTLTEKLDAAAGARRTATETLREEIRRAPAEDDAPVAPVLRRALDGLRDR